MTIVSEPDYDVEGPDDDPTEILDHEETDIDPDDESDTDFEDDETDPHAEHDDELDAEDEAEESSYTEDSDPDTEDPAAEDPEAELEEAELVAPAGETVEVDQPAEVDLPAEVVEADELEAPLFNAAALSTVSPAEPERTTASQPWTTRQLLSVAQRALMVFAVMGMIGYGLGAIRGDSHVARTEFVYTLDESVPDSFLREDRRLLTQVVTFKSDAVLTPVATEFDLTVDQLRSKIDVETLELSEVLRLDVADADATRALALSEAVLDQYLQVITDATPAGDNAELAQRRLEVTEQLGEADATRRSLQENLEQDAGLEVRQDSVQRKVDLNNAQIARIQQSLDDAVLRQAGSSQIARITTQLEVAQADLTELETDLIAIGTRRAELATDSTTEPALLREIDRLEAKLTTIDNELSERELAPLVASPIRELSQPIVLFRSMHLFGLQGMALGLMAAIPIAGLVAYRARRQQLWFD